jgi:hypothetical protein
MVELSLFLSKNRRVEILLIKTQVKWEEYNEYVDMDTITNVITRIKYVTMGK